MESYYPKKLSRRPRLITLPRTLDAMLHTMLHAPGTFDEMLYAPRALLANTTETISLQIVKELLSEIRKLSAVDKGIQRMWRKKVNGTIRDGKIALGLYEENNGVLLYDGLIWIPDNDDLQLFILRDHQDTQAVGHPGQARTLELVSRNFY